MFLSLVRTVRSGGNGSLIWPKDCTSIEDITHELALAVLHANRVLDWQENLGSDEMPPQWAWHLDDVVDEWFQVVEHKRNEKYGTKSQDETVPMMSNQLSRGTTNRFEKE